MTDTSQATTPNPPVAEKNFKRLLRLFSSYKGTIAAAVVAMIVTAGAAAVIALFVGKLTDAGFYEKDPNVIYWLPTKSFLPASLFLSSSMRRVMPSEQLPRFSRLSFGIRCKS